MRKLLHNLAYVVLIILFVGAGVGYINKADIKVKFDKLELKSDRNKLDILEKKYDDLNQQLEKSKQDKQQIKKLQQKQKQLEQEREKLKADLLAKRNRQPDITRATQTAVNTITGTKAVYASGGCTAWLAQAGVADNATVRELIKRESGCNPYAVNPSSGACGIAQELPCGKSGCQLGDAVCQLRWMQSYVVSRYGGWSGALAHHDAVNWY